MTCRPQNSLPFQLAHHFRLSVRSCSSIYTCLQTPLSSQTLSPWCWTTLEGHKTSMDSLLAIVDRCPELAHLSLRSCGPYQPKTSPSYPDAVRLVPLPKLRTLTMRSAPKSISSFLAHLSLPTTVSVTLEAAYVEDFTIMFTSVLPRDWSRVPQVANATHAQLFLRFYQWELRLSSFSAEDGAAQSLTIVCDHPPGQMLPRAIRDVAQLLGTAPIERSTFVSSIGRFSTSIQLWAVNAAGFGHSWLRCAARPRRRRETWSARSSRRCASGTCTSTTREWCGSSSVSSIASRGARGWRSWCSPAMITFRVTRSPRRSMWRNLGASWIASSRASQTSSSVQTRVQARRNETGRCVFECGRWSRAHPHPYR
ncbi:hypothetical protein B0H21DRAFT_748774 [Amylocystis lapponica]|nr:hypothetical protein B0H21DRAFT_748774 [Amylocystis lapponica]